MTSKTEFQLDWGLSTIALLLEEYDFETVLDVGSGDGEHKRLFEYFGKKVYSVDIDKDADYVGDFLDVKLDRTFDVVFCSHVIEHQRNVGLFLDKLLSAVDDYGIIAISLPTHPREIFITGHLTSWNAGLLTYNLIMAGQDCSNVRFKQDYELSYIAEKSPASGGDIGQSGSFMIADSIAHYFPYPPKDGTLVEIKQHNWPDKVTLPNLDQEKELVIHCKNQVKSPLKFKI